MRKFTVLFLAFVFICFGSLNAQELQPGKHIPKAIKGKEHLIDTRIDNMKYWRNMAALGYVEVAPVVPILPAKFTGSSLNSRAVAFDDSPDVPVTELNSTQSENSIFVNPLDPQNALNSNNSTENPVGSLYGANDFYTFDQGETWGGELQGAGGGNSGDPAACISLDGIYYVGYIHNNGGQGVSYSTDQGENWTAVLTQGGGWVLDKNHLWIDNSPGSPYEGQLYNAWTNMQSGGTNNEIEISRTTNQGQSWESSQEISSAVNAGSHNQGVNITTGPNGEVYVVWAIYDGWPTDETAIGFTKSYDGGATYETATRILSNIRGIRTSETSKNQRVNSFPSATCDISGGSYNGTIYITWSNIGVPGVNTGSDIDVYMIKSSDEGDTWSDPIKVNQDPSGEGKEHYFPWITCDPVYGTLSTIFYDDRNVGGNQCEVYCAVSSDGGSSWEDFKVSDVSFTPSPIPGLAGGYMGDYLGISARDRVVYPCWTDNRLGHIMTFVSPFVTGPPPDQPWVIYASHEIDDSQGNSNGQVDFGESILLDVTMENIGDTPATDVMVTITSGEQYITITDGEQNYGDFAVEESIEMGGAFGFDVSDSIPNNTKIAFEVTATDVNDSVFISGFTVTAYAPELTVGSLTISDPPPGNNNGRLDPGETVDVMITTKNTGEFDANNTNAMLATSSPFVTLNSTSFEFGTLTPDQTGTATFNLTVDEAATIGSAVPLLYYVSSDYHYAEKNFIEKIGLILEDFETGDFGQYDWVQGGNQPWTVSEIDPYEGMYSARSGSIGDYSTTEISLSWEVMFDDSISFYKRVSSEANYDYLNFYIDGNLKDQWAGEEAWSRVAYAVSEGPHTFKWIYAKDANTVGGEDKAWIDYIVFPPELRTSAYAGPDAQVCGGTAYQLNGDAVLYESILWTSTGTGTFDDNTILNPVYTPSEDDVVNGNVTLSITAYGPTREDVSDSMELTLLELPTADLTGTTSICIGDSALLTVVLTGAAPWDVLLGDSVTIAHFEESPDLSWEHPVETTSYSILTVTDINGCVNEATGVVEITVNPLPTATMSGDFEICPGDSIQASIELTGAPPWEFSIFDGVDMYLFDEIETSPFTQWFHPAEDMTYTLENVMDANMCQNDGDGEITVAIKPLPAVPVQPAGVDSVDVYWIDITEFTITEAANTLSYVWMIMPETAGIIEGEGLTGTVTWNEEFVGDVTISVQSVNDCGISDYSDNKEVLVYNTVGFEDLSHLVGIKVIPNPNSGLFKLEIESPVNELVTLRIMNAIGATVYQEDNINVNGSYTKTIDLGQFEDGMYYLFIDSNSIHKTEKIVVQK